MKINYSKWSAALSIICAITIFASYAIAPDQPEGTMAILIKILFFASILTGIMSLIFSYVAYKNKEEGFLKKIAPIVIILIILIFFLSLIGIIVSLGDLF